MSAILEAHGLSKSFGGFAAVTDVSFELAEGEVTGLVGSNGAGKSTLLNLLYGKAHVSSGYISFNGEDITDTPAFRRVRMGLGMVFQHTSVFLDMSVRENLRLGALRKGSGGDPSGEGDIDATLDLVGLTARQYEPAANLSHGEQQWLEIGMVLLCRPELLLLDEPTSGMTKPEALKTADLCRQLLESKSVRAIVVVEHNIDFIRKVSNRVLVMHRGTIIARGTIDEVQHDQNVRDSFLGRMA